MTLILTEEYAADLDNYCVLGKADRSLFVTSNRCISVRNALGLKVVVFFFFFLQMRQYSLLSVILYVVVNVHKFTLGLSQTNPTTHSDQCKKGHVVTKTKYVFPWPFSQVLRESTRSVQDSCIC